MFMQRRQPATIPYGAWQAPIHQLNVMLYSFPAPLRLTTQKV